MPAPGDQHRNGVINPFEEAAPRVSEYTAKEIATLQARLEKQLGPEYISSRSGPSGQKVHYITAEKCIALANEVFGFNGWSSSIQNITIDFVDEHPQTMRISLGLSVVMRVTLRDGTYHEDIGYGHIENCKGKAAAFEKAKKEGTTDGLKRALRNFGNVLGNCIYDKDYLGKVTKIKATPVRFEEANLHRHGDFAVKKETAVVKVEKKEETQPTLADLEEVDLLEDFGDFDDADLCIQGEGHPDEVSLPPTTTSSVDKTAPSANTSAPSRPPIGNNNNNGFQRPPQTPNNNQAQTGRPVAPQGGMQMGGQQGRPVPPQRPGASNHSGPSGPNGPNTHNNQPNRPPPQQAGGPAPPATFFSARAIQEVLDAGAAGDGVAVKPQQVFNPKAESPSIRKTPGFDHTSSKPVAREAIPTSRPGPAGPSNNGPASGPGPNTGARPSGGGFQPPGRSNMVNPHLDQTRRIGTPGAGGSPLANRGQYRPPTMKRPLPGDAAGRPALAEVAPNAGVPQQGGGNADPKRQKMG